MKPSKKNEILAAVKRVSGHYERFRNESKKVEKLIKPYYDRAIILKDKKMLNYLIDITQPISKDGIRAYGDFIGRFYLFLALTEIEAKKKKK
jgi:hypothetical protein